LGTPSGKAVMRMPEPEMGQLEKEEELLQAKSLADQISPLVSINYYKKLILINIKI
jgi:hypothetical protein